MVFTRKLIFFIILLICCIPLFFLNIHDTHIWGDDYAQYIKEALNIASNKHYYASNYVFNELNTDYGPPQYPPGFPLLLAPIVKISGIAIRPMLYLNAVFLSCLLFIFFCYFKKYTSDVVAVCIALIGIYCGFILEIKQSIYSDLPCTVFISLYFLLRSRGKQNSIKILALIVVATMAILIRTQSLLLIIAECFLLLINNIEHLIITKKINIKNFLTPPLYVIIGSLLCYFFISHFIFYSPASTFDYYTHMAASFHRNELSLIEDIYYYKALFGSIFWYPYSTSLTDPFVNIAMDIGYLSCFLGFIMNIKKRIRLEDIFFILMSLIVFAVPVRQGFRLLLPALMIILFYSYTSVSSILFYTLRIKGNTSATILTFLYLLLGHNAFKFSLKSSTDNTPYGGDDKYAFNYIKQNVNDSDIIIFTKARALTLYTGKRGMVAAPQLDFEDNKIKFNAVKAKYMLINRTMDYNWYMGYLNNTHTAIDSLKINNTYTLYTLKN